jgi:hypothetical protein
VTATNTAAPTPGTGIRVPDDLSERDQWVLWRSEQRGGKPTKVPYQANGKPASSTDPSTWANHQEVAAAYAGFPKHWSGIGFVFSPEDPYCGIDLDDCVSSTGELKAWAQPIIGTFADSYMELSPSGHGVKIWCRATLPGAGRSKKDEAGEGIEVYDRGRYFTVTGDAFNGAPSQIEDHQRDVERLYALVAGNGNHGASERAGPKADLHDSKSIPEGQRYAYLQSVAAQYRARGMDREEVYAALAAINSRRCNPPKLDSVLRELADWAATLEPGKRGVGQTGTDPDKDQQETTFAGIEPVPYPKPISEDAYIGIAGRFVRAVAPHTEADPNFMLVSFLAYAGNAFGRDAYVSVSGDHHHANLYVCGVGPTSSGRKGTAKVPVEALFRPIDDDWSGQWTGGLSSGEGLIAAVQDPIFKREKAGGKKGEPIRYEEVCIDEGVSDKRLIVRQGEFASALKVMRRDGNTLSPTLRDGWDGVVLHILTKNNRAKATDAHITIIGNITREELLRFLEDGEIDNGLANRFLWCCSIRSRFLPEGGLDFNEVPGFDEIRKDFNRIHYKVKGKVVRDAEASELWGYNDAPDRGAFRELSREKFGMYGSATARAASQVLRLALVYALLDGSAQICRQHLDAALEVWRYCDESARFIFGDRLGNPIADTILEALRKTPGGITRGEISAGLFGRNKTSAQLTTAFVLLTKGGLARCEVEKTPGRPGERWFAVTSGGEKCVGYP